jgi:hypothetical protein
MIVMVNLGQPCCRLPYTRVVSCASASSKELNVETTFFTTCKAGNLDLPYSHQNVTDPVKITIDLEFEGSMTNLMPQLMHVLGISKIANITEKDELLQVRLVAMLTDRRHLHERFCLLDTACGYTPKLVW